MKNSDPFEQNLAIIVMRYKRNILDVGLSVALIGLGVVSVYELLDTSPFVAVVVGGGCGCAVARVILRSRIIGKQEEGKRTQSMIAAPAWVVFWLMALVAFRFLAALTWPESVCCVIALIVFFLGMERWSLTQKHRRAGDDS